MHEAWGDGIVGSGMAVAADAVDWRRGGGAGVCEGVGVTVDGESTTDGGNIGGVGTELGLGVGASTKENEVETDAESECCEVDAGIEGGAGGVWVGGAVWSGEVRSTHAGEVCSPEAAADCSASGVLPNARRAAAVGAGDGDGAAEGWRSPVNPYLNAP